MAMEVVVVYLEVLTYNLLWGTEKNHKNPYSVYLVHRPKL